MSYQFSAILALCAFLLSLAHFGSYACARVRQPRVIGEIFAVWLVGATFIQFALPELANQIRLKGSPTHSVLAFGQELGLIFLMFCSGTEMKSLTTGESKARLLTLVSFSMIIPGIVGYLLIDPMGWVNHKVESASALSFTILLSASVAVTSIPVISRILMDLKLMGTQFSRLVLSVAVVEDLILYGLISVALAARSDVNNWVSFAQHFTMTIVFFIVVLKLGAWTFRFLSSSRANLVFKNNQTAWILVFLCALVYLGSLLEVTPMLSAFLCGLVVQKSYEADLRIVENIKKFAFATVVPFYFSIVGLKLNLIGEVSFYLIASFLVVSSILKISSVCAAGVILKFPRKTNALLGVALNARGGPGIVLATIGYESGIFDAKLYTTLILAALLTSYLAGVVLQRNADDVIRFSPS